MWLTVGLVPFLYLFSIYVAYDGVFHRISRKNTGSWSRYRSRLALLSVLHFRAGTVRKLAGYWYFTRKLGEAQTFSAARGVVADFLDALRREEQAKIDEEDRLRRYSGSQELDDEGQRLDRREFAATIDALHWLATCQMGWHENGGRYRRDMLRVLGDDFTRHGLPRESGITLHVAQDGQSWYAWRRTVTGWCFAIGAAGPPPDQWRYDGPEPPRGFPAKDSSWGRRTVRGSGQSELVVRTPILFQARRSPGGRVRMSQRNQPLSFPRWTCREFYAERMGRPGLPPGVYFRMLMAGYLEGIGSERSIAWRCRDSISLREFLGYGLAKTPPEHSTLSKTRKRLSLEAHGAVFGWVLERLRESGLLRGKTVGVDSTTLEANAAMRAIVRRDDRTEYDAWLEQLARASGIETPTRQDLAKLDRKRPKKGSNKDWKHPHDPEARITKMKDGRTRLAHKLEVGVDMETGVVAGVTVQTMDGGDTASLPVTLDETERQLAEVGAEPKEVVGDKGYHSNATMTGVKDRGLRSYVSEPNRGRRKWKGKRDAQKAVYGNRRRIRGNRGKRLLRRRGEKLERTFAHLLVSGGLRRVHVRGQKEIRKRLLVHAAAFNLGLMMRARFGFGTPRGL